MLQQEAYFGGSGVNTLTLMMINPSKKESSYPFLYIQINLSLTSILNIRTLVACVFLHSNRVNGSKKDPVLQEQQLLMLTPMMTVLKRRVIQETLYVNIDKL